MHRTIFLALISLVFVLPSSLLAQDAGSAPAEIDREQLILQLNGVLEGTSNGVYAGADGSFMLGSELFRAYGELRFVNDGKWYPTEGWMPEGFYLDLKEAAISSLQGPFILEGGFLRARHYASENPFSQLLDAEGKSGVGAVVTYDGDFFIYQSRWISINQNSIHNYNYGLDPSFINSQWQDRGFNHKLYLLKLGNYRLGYQESSLFLGRSFDANYFLSPAPSIFTNTLWSRQLMPNPWVQDTNDSSYMGFYGDWEDGPFRAEGEIIIKDVNLSSASTNLNKLAWSAGLQWLSPWGRLAFWHGGATKHMYSATYQDSVNPNIYPYEYTYYPQDIIAGKTVALEDNYIGFKYGENSLAFRFSWENQYKPFGLELDLDAALDYVISGSKAPHNPWHEYISCDEITNKTELFHGDTVLEHRLSARLQTQVAYLGWYAGLDLVLGRVFNPLALTHTPETESRYEHPIWKPQASQARWINSFRLSVGYILSL